MKPKRYSHLAAQGHINIDQMLELADNVSSSGILLVDTRPHHLFANNHIVLFDHIVNIDSPGIETNTAIEKLVQSSMSANTEQVMGQLSKTWDLVVVIDQISTADKIQHSLKCLMEILKSAGHDVVFLDGGFLEWQEFMGEELEPVIMSDKDPIEKPANVQASSSSTDKGKQKEIQQKPKLNNVNEKAATNVMKPTVAPPKTLSMNIKCGLHNLGNTCYMNSVLQCLVHVEELTRFFVSNDFPREMKLVQEYKSLLKTMLRSSNAVSPRSFKKLLGKLNDQFAGYEQQDSAEFLHYLLDALHEELNKKKNRKPHRPLTEAEEAEREKMPLRLSSAIAWEMYLTSNESIILNIFGGQYCSKLQCWSCHFTSTTFIPFTMLTLPINEINAQSNTVDVYDCLNRFTKPEKLIGENAWKCPKCKEQKVSFKKMDITRFPRVLIIHLERFKYNMRKRGFEKDTQPVQFDDTLELGGYLVPVKDQNEANHLAKLSQSLHATSKLKYHLESVVDHVGTLNGGHYTSVVGGVSKYDDETRIPLRATPSYSNSYVAFYSLTG